MKPCSPASRNLQRHGDSQIVLSVAFLIMGFVFWAVAKYLDGAVMDADTYGDFVGGFPAEWWAGSVMTASFVYLAGITINGRWRWSVVLRLAGVLWHMITLSAFAYGGWSSPRGLHLCIWAGLALGIFTLFLWWNLGDFARALRSESWPPRKTSR